MCEVSFGLKMKNDEIWCGTALSNFGNEYLWLGLDAVSPRRNVKLAVRVSISSASTLYIISSPPYPPIAAGNITYEHLAMRRVSTFLTETSYPKSSMMKKILLHRRALHSLALRSLPSASPSDRPLPSRLLSSCQNLDSLLRVHALLVVVGIANVNTTSTLLLKAYTSFHKLNWARLVFDSAPNPDVVLFNLMMRAYTRSNQDSKALELYRLMLDEGIKPDKYTYTLVVKACTGIPDFEEGLSVHKRIVGRGLEGDVFIATALVDMYSKMGRVSCAKEVFDKMPLKDVVTWNAMIDGLAQSADPREAMCLFREMQLSGTKPNPVSLLNLFPAVCKLLDVGSCRSIHGFVIRRDFKIENLNGLIDTYSKCGRPDIARVIFSQTKARDDVSWGVIMSGYAHNGFYEEVLDLFDDMKRESMIMNKVSFVSASLAASELRDLEKGKEIHKCAVTQCVDSDILVATTLMTMYAKCGELNKAKEMFDGLVERDIVAWSACIASFVQGGFPVEALSLFREMLDQNFRPNELTLMSILPACAELSDSKLGRSIHCYALKASIESEVSAGSALVSMYAKCGLFGPAMVIFHRMKHKGIVTWNALINGYAQMGYPCHVMEIFYDLRSSGINPDAVTIVGLLPACALSRNLIQGASIHGLVVKSGFESNFHVKNSLIDMYANCGRLSSAESLFSMPDFNKGIVRWNTMISAYANNGCPEKAISVFTQMKTEVLEPNIASLVSVLPAVADMTALGDGMALHAYTVKKGFQSNTNIGNSLIDMYSKCGRFDHSEKYFDEMEDKSTVSWNAILTAYALHGCGEEAVKLFSAMQDREVMVDSVSFLSVLSACRHSGLVEEGRKLFHLMRDKYNLEPGMEHYSCIVDLFARSGQFDEVMKLISEMPMDPGAAIWGSILGACRMHCNFRLAEVALDHLAKLEPKNPAHYVGLSNVYAQSGRWTDARDAMLKLTNNGLKKIPGCSWF